MALDEQLFPKKQEPAPAQDTTSQIGAVATRLKLAEGRYKNLQRRNQLNEDVLLSFEKEMKTELRVLTKQIVELRRHVTEINTKVDIMVGETGSVVQKHEFSTVERYLDLWQPMHFVTKDEAKRLIQDVKNDA